ncbi:hypothetical protein [Variovorax sp. DT-64]|uniref:hypothetical protein n=1 Tax=Variovorax sp. DT-64 TaxID=3396160 RepID=UPI003F540574
MTEETLQADAPPGTTLRYVLLLRGACSVLFALYFLVAPLSRELHGLTRAGYYALGDGVLALALAAALFRDPRGQWLFVLAVVDALVRLALGAMILANPSLNASVLLGALFSVTIVIAFIALGSLGMLFVAVGRLGRDPGSNVSRGGAWPAFIASACALLFGIGLIVGLPGSEDRRLLVGAYALALGLTLLLTGLRRSQESP